jgi:hypothetical protein
LRACGVPEDALLPAERIVPPGVQVDVVLLDPHLPLPEE